MQRTAKALILASCLILLPLAAPAEAGTGKNLFNQQEKNFFSTSSSAWGNDLILQKNTFFPQQDSKLCIMPVDGPVTSEFGTRKLSRRSATRMHKGIDISAPRGTTVVASADGVVVSVEKKHAYGRLVDVDHGNGIVTRYAHLDSACVLEGAAIKAGDPLGTVGRTGRTTGPNLHFEIIVNGKQVDPLQASLWSNGDLASAAHVLKKNNTAPQRSKAAVSSAAPQRGKAVASKPKGVNVASRGKRTASLSSNTLP